MSQFQLVAHEYPRYSYGRLNLAYQYDFLGQHEQAVAELREVVHLQPDSFVGYTNLGYAYIGLDRLDDAQGIFKEALSRNLEAPSLHRGLYFVAFFKNDASAMQQELSWAMGKPGAEGPALLLESDTQAYYGRLAKARDVTRRAVAAELRNGAVEPAASMEAMEAIREARLGNAAQARKKAHAALALARDYNTRLESATALAYAMDSHAAQQLLDLVSKERPLDTMVQGYWLPTIRAQIELNHGRARRALELVESARPYEQGSDDAPMYPVYVRGQAYLATGNGAAAAIEFQTILGHRGLMLNDVTGALARLYLGRSRALEARSLQGAAAEDARANARTAYEDFLTLWKAADPDIPILRQAKAERSKLQEGFLEHNRAAVSMLK